ncbi:MAG: c-type cytochrome [Pseudomonadales bacterium]
MSVARFSRSLLFIWLSLIALPLVAREADTYRQLGTAVSGPEVALEDTDLAPTGKVPEGQGSVTEGERLYASQCQHCHGAKGLGGLHEPLALTPEQRSADANRPAFALDVRRPRVIGNYWPYATTLYDYIRRAMPQANPGSLSNDEAYSLTAYVLFLNALVQRDTRVDGVFLQNLVMPAREHFDYSVESQLLFR